MPLYDYYCSACDTQFEEIVPLIEVNILPFCPNCENFRPCEKLITVGHGGYQRPDSEWIKQVNMVNESGRPINTIEDLRSFYKQNPEIRPIDSHPALDSSLGDAASKPDLKEQKRQRLKKGVKALAEHRAVTIN